MTFSVRHFLRQLRPTILRSYFDQRQAQVPELYWKYKESKLAAALADFVMNSPDDAAQVILSDLTRCHPMATERGRTAMLNATASTANITQVFGGLANDYERSIWFLMTHEGLFREAEELRFFDYYTERRQGRGYTIAAGKSVSPNAVDHQIFLQGVQAFFRHRDGSGRSCHIDLIDRHTDASIQLSIYVQGLPNNTTEFVENQFRRSVSHRAIEAAIVYTPATGHLATVVTGGREVHEALVTAFMQSLLHVAPEFSHVTRRGFQLDRLSRDEGLAPIAEMGVAAVRVRKLRLAPPSGLGILTIEAPAGSPSMSVYSMANSWFAERAAIYSKFTVIHATIAIHYEREPGRMRTRTINLELTLPNTSNLRSLGDLDRQVAEAHLKKWALLG